MISLLTETAPDALRKTVVLWNWKDNKFAVMCTFFIMEKH